jgi:class 3 adenylate cyclase
LAELPSGTVTFLFTDLEGSTRLWEEHPERLISIANGGQVIVSNVTEELVRDVLPEGVALRLAASVHKLRSHIHEHRESA